MQISFVVFCYVESRVILAIATSSAKRTIKV